MNAKLSLCKNIVKDENDSRYKSLKENFLNDLKKNIECEDYNQIIDYFIELLMKENIDCEKIEEEFKEIFEEKSHLLMNNLLYNVEKLYGKDKKPNNKNYKNKNQSNDILEEFNESKTNENKKSGKTEFTVGGKVITLKNKNHENNNSNDSNKNYRERSRDKETGMYNQGYNSQMNPNPKNFYMYNQQPRMKGMHMQYPSQMQMGMIMNPMMMAPPMRFRGSFPREHRPHFE